MDDIITFACGSSGHRDYCPGECQFGRFCKFLKNQPVKPRGGLVEKGHTPTPKKAEQPGKPVSVEPYY